MHENDLCVGQRFPQRRPRALRAGHCVADDRSAAAIRQVGAQQADQHIEVVAQLDHFDGART